MLRHLRRGSPAALLSLDLNRTIWTVTVDEIVAQRPPLLCWIWPSGIKQIYYKNIETLDFVSRRVERLLLDGVYFPNQVLSSRLLTVNKNAFQ